jgi:hypothetical protein
MAKTKTKRTTKTRPTATPAAPKPPPEQVASLAYAKWTQEGCPVGRDVEHWLQAEAELCGRHQPHGATA